MGQVFISHSQDDTEGKEFLTSLFISASHDYKPFFYSWEGPRPPHAETLRKRIEGSSSLFVLLSPELEDKFTLAWVSFEVGMAVGLGKRVWVLERLIGSRGPLLVSSGTRVPIPGVTGYIERLSKLKSLRTEPYYSLVAKGGTEVPIGPDGESLPRMICPRESCQAEYYFYSEGPILLCPVCRKEIKRT
jgi:hypothetical protein